MSSTIFKFTQFQLLKSCNNLWSIGQLSKYSQYNNQYVSPVPTKEGQQRLEESGEIKPLKYLPIKAACTDEHSLYNYDPVVRKFQNYLMRKGNKDLSRSLLDKAFENVKRLQLARYHKETDPEEKEKIITDPLKILHLAVENCKPLLVLISVKRGGAYYQVPMPITETTARFYSMNWLIEAGSDKARTSRWTDRMAIELIDASENKGRVIKRKQDLHKQCEANRAYAHYRWG
ncbi:28S ribosomal protein S7, mitochondrial [Nilaparvata lugens]|uniref:28S ribosomal protein S7, mitochondrial n=1 Tax=Nilaparvata lugens TaxID=108931 RepID=UPI000B97D14A|nr:28S ribosomal protein S7, mitochondrial [Nilaparvata lugens]